MAVIIFRDFYTTVVVNLNHLQSQTTIAGDFTVRQVELFSRHARRHPERE